MYQNQPVALQKHAETAQKSGASLYSRQRYSPLFKQVELRTALGFLLLSASALFTGVTSSLASLLSLGAAWTVAVFLTHKYIHKYPQRYFTYLLASHGKAALIMGLLLWLITLVLDGFAPSTASVWRTFFIFILLDGLVSVPRRKENPLQQLIAAATKEQPKTQVEQSTPVAPPLESVDRQAILNTIGASVEEPYRSLILAKVENAKAANGNVIVVDNSQQILPMLDEKSVDKMSVGLIVNRLRINDIGELDLFFARCARSLQMGGYFVGRYIPHEFVKADLKKKYAGPFYIPLFLLHFIWQRAFPKIPGLNHLYRIVTKDKNKVISKVEVWGRLAYAGMTVVAESEGDGEVFLLARRTGPPVQNRKPSYYPIISLEKVGLDGEIMYAHKLRTMYPYSEFLQKRVFEEHGLAATGKFKDDFRRTEYGRFLRKYWLDELPQAIDLLRGDIKLVGMRATSPHFLSLYPKELYDLYIQIKPGIMSPIFDDSVTSFEQIADIELAYLKSYWDHPISTDLKYLAQTVTDIVFRGVRSK